MRLLYPQRTHGQLDPVVLRVVTLVAQGMSNEEIARVLSYSPRTVKNYVAIAAHVFGTRNRTGTVMAAMRAGTITCPHGCRVGHPPRRKPRPGRRNP